MFEPLATPRRIEKVSACRREGQRRKLAPLSVICWSEADAPNRAAAIETDCKGARLMLSMDVLPGELISVSLEDQVGHYITERARVVWTERLESTGRIVAGVAFERELPLAS